MKTTHQSQYFYYRWFNPSTTLTKRILSMHIFQQTIPLSNLRLLNHLQARRHHISLSITPFFLPHFLPRADFLRSLQRPPQRFRLRHALARLQNLAEVSQIVFRGDYPHLHHRSHLGQLQLRAAVLRVPVDVFQLQRPVHFAHVPHIPHRVQHAAHHVAQRRISAFTSLPHCLRQAIALQTVD